jgi:DNA polymerase III delta prime subunit
MNEFNSNTGPPGQPLNTLAAQIRDHLESAKQLYHRFILVVGGPGTGKTTAFYQLSKVMGLSYVNVNMQLSQRLLEFTSKARPLRLLKLLDDILESAGTNTVLADNTEILFDVRLKQDPLKCLEAVSRNRTVVVTWNGRIDANALVYAEPGHPEYRRYSEISGLVIDAATNTGR